MNFRKYPITKNDADRRLDRVIRRFLPDLPLSGIYKLMRKGLIRVDGRRIEPDFHVSEGEVLYVAAILMESRDAEIERGKNIAEISAKQGDSLEKLDKKPGKSRNSSIATGFFPEIVLETEDLLFINKPKGLPVHGENSLDTLIGTSTAAIDSLSFRTGPLHRLDKDTTGLITFSRTLAGARWFSAGIRDRRFEKYYLGIATGSLSCETEWRDRDGDGKEMITLACPLAHSRPGTIARSLIRYRIVTGKKHQIRIQSALHGHPLCGDIRYAVVTAAKNARGDSYFLHAWQMVFPVDRLSGLPDRIVAPLQADFAGTVREHFGEYVLAHIEKAELYWSHDEEHQ
jgi:23S rRNA pseudouridine955/2504/2580 synthase